MEKAFLWDYSLFPLYFLCLLKSTFLSNKFSFKALSISYSFWHLCNKYDVVVKTALSLVQMLVLPFTSYVDLGIFIIHKSVSPFLKIGEIMILIWVDSLKKTLMLGGIGGRRRRGRQRMRWLDGITTRWTWVWVNSRSWWWTGRPGVLRFMGSQRVRHDWATDLIWYIHK